MSQDRGPISSQLPGHLIRRLHQLSTLAFSKRTQAAGFDLTPVQFVSLDALLHRPGIDQASLADIIAKDRATTGAVVDRLIQKGLVARAVSQHDKRARELQLTQKGEEIIRAMMPVVEALQSDILPGLSEGEYQQFLQLAQKAIDAA